MGAEGSDGPDFREPAGLQTPWCVHVAAVATASPDGVVGVGAGVAPDDAPRRLASDMVVSGGTTISITAFRPLARVAGLEIAAAGPAGFVVEREATS